MSFLQQVKKANDSVVLGENGHVELSRVAFSDDLLALFYKLVRGMDEEEIKKYVDSLVGKDDKELLKSLFLLAFSTRNCRGGKGEKKIFYYLLKYLYAHKPLIVEGVLDLIPKHGYWKDLFLLSLEIREIRDKVHDICAEQHKKELNSDNCVSLYAKFVPSEKSSLDRKLNSVYEISTRVYGNERDRKKRFRKDISQMRKKLKVTETFMCSKNFSGIDFSTVPSICMNRNIQVFLNETKDGELRYPDDEDRMKARENMINALSESKINGKQLFPHEIVDGFLKNKNMSKYQKITLETQWKRIRENIVEMTQTRMSGVGSVDISKSICMCDVSGSMSGQPMSVSIAMGILCSEITHPVYRDVVLTFSHISEFHDLSECKTLEEKVESLESAEWEMNTDFYRAMTEIGKVVKINRLKQDEIPTLIVISDMQFDLALGDECWNTAYENIKRYFRRLGNEVHGIPMNPPPIVFWNVRSGSVGFPTSSDQEGVVLMSGFSPSLMKFILSGEMMVEEEVVDEETGEVKKVSRTVTPKEMLQNILNDSILDDVRKRLEELID